MLQGLLGIFSGLITPVQTAVNTRLGRSIGSPLRASLVSFSVGLIAMLTLTLLLGPYPLIPATAANGPWWMWFAGVFGVTFLTGNVLLLPKLGSLKTVIMPVTGQPLPLISKGGTSTLVNCVYIGMILSISRYVNDLKRQQAEELLAQQTEQSQEIAPENNIIPQEKSV